MSKFFWIVLIGAILIVSLYWFFLPEEPIIITENEPKIELKLFPCHVDEVIENCECKGRPEFWDDGKWYCREVKG
jgi:hypothetical protein